MTLAAIVELINEKMTEGGTKPKHLKDHMIEEYATRVTNRFHTVDGVCPITDEQLLDAPLVQASILEECERMLANFKERYNIGE